MAPARTTEDIPEPKTSYDINLTYQTLEDDYLQQSRERTEFPGYLPVWEVSYLLLCRLFCFTQARDRKVFGMMISLLLTTRTQHFEQTSQNHTFSLVV